MFNETITSDDTLTTNSSTADVQETVVEKNTAPIVTNYLDKSILEIKTISFDEVSQYDEDGSAEIDDMYLESFSDIKEGEVATGTVVNITDREVFIDIGFKSEGIVPKSEFSEISQLTTFATSEVVPIRPKGI